MSNYGAKIMNTAVGALSAQQAVMGVISNNIANVNTPGYVKRSLDLTARPGSQTESLAIGAGVQVSDVQRTVDQYVEKLLRESGGDKASYNTQTDMLQKVDGLFDLTGSVDTIGKQLTAFFSSANDLRANPSSTDLRNAVITQGQALATAISGAYQKVAQVQDEADDRLRTEVEGVNQTIDKIAQLNSDIVQREKAGGTAADSRDQREELIRTLNEKIGFSRIDQSDGSAYIALDGGFPLVSGPQARHLEVTSSPSFSSAAVPSLSGKPQLYVAYNYAPSGAVAQHIDLTQVAKRGGGTIGGLLTVRGYNAAGSTSPFTADGPLVAIGSRIESIARTLLTSFNQIYRGADEDSGTAGFQPNALDLNGATPGVFGLFGVNSSYAISDSDGDGLATATDLTATGYTSFADKLQFAVSDPTKFAAARDVNATAGTLQLAPGNADNVTALVGARTTTFNLGPVGNTRSMTVESAYQDMVSYSGGAVQTAQSGAKIAEGRYNTVKAQYDSTSGVSLDEEFTKLVKFQKAYEASARLIKTSAELLDTVIGLL